MSTSPQRKIAKDGDELAELAADLFLAAATEAVRRKGAFFAALSGGSTPRGMHQRLAQSPYRTAVPWHRIHLFWVDERCVPHTDSASNFGQARRDFLQTVGIPQDRIHPMPTEPGSERAAAAYEDRLKSIAPSRADGMPVLDLVVLGLGKDGHTASLFPQDSALMEDTRQVLSVRGGMPYVFRFTLTLPVLNSARHVFFLVSGANKAPIVKQILTTDSSPFLPAQQVQPTDGKIIWLLDRAAASHL